MRSAEQIIDEARALLSSKDAHERSIKVSKEEAHLLVDHFEPSIPAYQRDFGWRTDQLTKISFGSWRCYLFSIEISLE